MFIKETLSDLDSPEDEGSRKSETKEKEGLIINLHSYQKASNLGKGSEIIHFCNEAEDI